MSLLTICLVIIVVGFLLYLANALIPMEGTVKKVLNIVVIVVLCVWLLKAFGLWSYLHRVTF